MFHIILLHLKIPNLIGQNKVRAPIMCGCHLILKGIIHIIKKATIILVSLSHVIKNLKLHIHRLMIYSKSTLDYDLYLLKCIIIIPCDLYGGCMEVNTYLFDNEDILALYILFAILHFMHFQTYTIQ